MLKKVFNFVKKNLFLILIVFIAAAARLYSLGNMPPSLNWDEVSHGYNAFSILTTGRDEWGVLFPSIFRAYGDYKLPVYIYLTAISEFFFGLNAFAVRFPSALAGIGIVIFTYLLAKELFKSREVAVLSSFLVAIEPWSLFLSRGAFEANVALFFILAGVYFFLKSFFPNTKYLILSTIFFGFSVWTYNSARIFVPMLLAVLILVFHNELLRIYTKNKKYLTYSLFLVALFFLPMFWQLLNAAGQARYGKVSIIDEGAVAQIIEARNNSPHPPTITRLIYNRPTYFVQRFITNWGSHFTCSFLFFNGGDNYQFSVPGHGLIYVVNSPFFLLGFVLLLKRILKKDRTSVFILTWLFLAPIPDSLTREAPHVLRSITMLPMPMILTAIGIVSFVGWSTKFVGKMMQWPTWPSGIKITFNRDKALYLAYILILCIMANNYLTKYFDEYRKDYSWSWQYGYEQVVDYVKERYDKYDKIIVTKKYGEPHEFFLFYWPWDSEKYRSDPELVRYSQSDWFWVDRFDKFYFINDWDIPKEEWQKFKLESGGEFNCDGTKCLLVSSPGNVPKGWSKLETINFLNGEQAFEIYGN